MAALPVTIVCHHGRRFFCWKQPQCGDDRRVVTLGVSDAGSDNPRQKLGDSPCGGAGDTQPGQRHGARWLRCPYSSEPVCPPSSGPVVNHMAGEVMRLLPKLRSLIRPGWPSRVAPGQACAARSHRDLPGSVRQSCDQSAIPPGRHAGIVAQTKPRHCRLPPGNAVRLASTHGTDWAVIVRRHGPGSRPEETGLPSSAHQLDSAMFQSSISPTVEFVFILVVSRPATAAPVVVAVFGGAKFLQRHQGQMQRAIGLLRPQRLTRPRQPNQRLSGWKNRIQEPCRRAPADKPVLSGPIVASLLVRQSRSKAVS